jgi:prevent-host-death family protein
MRKAGIREARQHLSTLIEEVRNGHEVLITDRGKAVARLVAPRPKAGRRFPSHAAFRSSMPVLDPPLSASLASEREDRI